MAHVRSCPHECEACKNNEGLAAKMVFWLQGLCPVCHGDRGGGMYACDFCFDDMNHAEQTELMKEVQKYV